MMTDTTVPEVRDARPDDHCSHCGRDAAVELCVGFSTFRLCDDCLAHTATELVDARRLAVVLGRGKAELCSCGAAAAPASALCGPCAVARFKQIVGG